jgi:hypothetical protein
MKIYRRADFLKLPAGIIFCKGEPFCWENIHIKGDSIYNDLDPTYNDWFEIDPCTVASRGSSQEMERLEDMLENGTSFPMSEGSGRDGCFEKDAIFLVWEETDLHILADWINKAIQIATVTGRADTRFIGKFYELHDVPLKVNTSRVMPVTNDDNEKLKKAEGG